MDNFSLTLPTACVDRRIEDSNLVRTQIITLISVILISFCCIAAICKECFILRRQQRENQQA
jgi:hypothetical protein